MLELFTVTHFQSLWSQDPGSDLLTLAWLRAHKAAHALSSLLIHAGTIPREERGMAFQERVVVENSTTTLIRHRPEACSGGLDWTTRCSSRGSTEACCSSAVAVCMSWFIWPTFSPPLPSSLCLDWREGRGDHQAGSRGSAAYMHTLPGRAIHAVRRCSVISFYCA